MKKSRIKVPIVYHGSNKAFDRFEKRVSKRNVDYNPITGVNSVEDVTSPCHFFAEDRASALRFAKDRALIDERLFGLPHGKPIVRAYRLKISKPLDFLITREVEDRMMEDGFSSFYNPEAPSPYALEIIEQMTGVTPEDWNGVQAMLDDADFVDQIQCMGYDGVRLRETDGSVSWAVFDPDLIVPVAKRRGK